MRHVKLILGDQLNARHSWFRAPDDRVVFVLAELRQETDYVVHHRQKVLAFFAAMRQFAEALSAAGHQVRYFTLDDTARFRDLPEWLHSVLAEEGADAFSYQQPDEYRLDEQMRAFCRTLEMDSDVVDSEHFLTGRDAWNEYPNSRLEYFYRALRKQYQVLMDDEQKPLGGQWNFDADNREALPKEAVWPEPLRFATDVSDIDGMLQRHGVKTLGRADPRALLWPTSREQSRQLLMHFLKYNLASFGRYQDAMTPEGWSLFHSRLAFSLNSKMLHPLEVIREAEAHWHRHQDEITLAQVEGFIRQILGWREYVRALYWQHMPEYGTRNHLRARRALPAYYWTGKTRMACMAHAIGQSLEYAYAHHIQRLMVTGNFALLAGIDPDAVDAWYLGIYIDAVEWVEMPNTRGMSQYADGGLIASKPYAASGQYIRKMSHYCRQCAYKVNAKTGPDSCPFNSLYWHFLARNRETLKGNARLKLVYANWDRQNPDQREAVLNTAEHHLSQINKL
ncbi:cryptochrome/photolyase family protein [Marinimicrobium sp. C2-29]|uniref:cryptochrome/photolyase family protein n=1 Tax=Marinimicrobium sp. C2-29 TaxID=3139825 RepID=UPI00313996A1